MNSEKIKELAEQVGFHFYDLHDVHGQDLGETVEAYSWNCAEKFAELIVESIDTEAIRLIKYIANDYHELSHHKIEWQRNDYVKRCQQFLKNLYLEDQK